MIRTLIIIAGLVAVGWSFRRWREAVHVALVLVIFEGAIRKWFVPGAQDLFYFAKDVFLLGAYAGFLQSPARQRYPPPAAPLLYGALIAGMFVGVLQIFNPNLPNLLVGILGFKAYFFYVPLILVLPAMYRTDQEVAVALRRYLLLAIPVGLLAVAQFFSPAGSVLNTYARSQDPTSIVTFGNSLYVRVTATFSFITGYTSYLLATTIFLLTWMAHVRWRLRGNLLMYAALGITLLGMLMSGSRSPVVMSAALFPLYWWLGVLREQGGGSTFGRLLLSLSLLAAVLALVGGDAIGAFAGRARGGAEDMSSRMLLPLQAPFHVIGDAGAFGFGIGATHQTAVAVTPGLPPFIWLRGLLIEVESGRVMLELGIIGFALVYLVRLYLVFFAFGQIFRLRTRFHRSLAVGSFLYLLGSLPGGIVFEVTAGLYYWTFVGLLFVAMRLDQEAVRVARAAQRAAPAPVPAAQPAPAWHARSE